MDRFQYELITKTKEERKFKPIDVELLRPFFEDRTLLYGYTCERETFHVYLKNKEIHVVVYRNRYNENGKLISPENMREINPMSAFDYIPNKRLYPERCDYKFATILERITEIRLPFTHFADDIEERDFYGFTLDS